MMNAIARPSCGLGRPISDMPRENPMKKFMVLYMASGADFERMMRNSTPEQQKKGMEAWMKWMNANKTSIAEGGAPLGKTKRVDSTGASNAKNEIGGYSIVQAESHDAATKIFGKDHPHLQMPGAWIEIVEIMPMPGT
jgi:YCII-related domain